MSDMFDAVKRAAERPGREMADRLRGDSVAAARGIVRGRRRRAIGQGALALSVAGAIGAGAAILPSAADDRQPVDPGLGSAWDGTMSGAVVGEVETVPDVAAWMRSVNIVENPSAQAPIGFCVDAYDPPAEVGLTIFNESVLDLGIRVETEFPINEDLPPEFWGFPTLEDPDGTLLMKSYDYLPANAVLRVSWSGERHLQVVGYIVLVDEEGVMQSYALPFGGPSDPVDSIRTDEWPGYYEKSVDRSGDAVMFKISPVSCGLYGVGPLALIDDSGEEGSELEYRKAIAGDYVLHVVVQVSDETGVPLATFVDAAEIAGTRIRVLEPDAQEIETANRVWED